ncbi:tetratricopeptide repeat protein [Sediminicurvatus halobius]|uniref:Uncharacterized protein n=1 Tax=Sediminicurvatus halobius TaxID=2182432 RepID=A0A2U2MZP4_9GAMM|nr:tetratricopeptide repeat protein [Spiribacter halobius]PWG62209.1 hypothetical protein DEM34_12940 [Spiribacter halobius]UEX78115.1 tetratricopeptide repeat protein [Spiribacter halobius]
MNMPRSAPPCPEAANTPGLDVDPLPAADNVAEHLGHSARGGRRLLLTGPEMSGRTATLRTWLAAAREGRWCHVHAAGLAPDRDSPAGVIHGLLTRLRRQLDAADALPLDESGLREALPGWLARLGTGPALIVIDDLDRITGSDLTGEPDWLPAHLPPGVTLVATARRGLLAERLRELGWERLDMNREADPATLLPDYAGAEDPVAAALADVGPERVPLLGALWAAPTGLDAETLAALGLPEPAGDPLVLQDGRRWRLRHAGLRDAVARTLLPGGAERRACHARLAAVIDEPLARARHLALAADWTGLLETLARPEALAAWRGAPFAWQSLWAELPARDTAISHLIQALDTLRRKSGEVERMALAHDGAGRILEQLEAPDAARAVREAAYTRLQALAPESPTRAAAAHQLALSRSAAGDQAGAAAPLREALELRETTLGEDHPDTRSTRAALAATLEANDDLDGATSAYARLLAAREATLGREDAALIPHLTNLGAVHRAANHLERARAPFERAVKLARRHYGDTHPALASALDNLGGLLYAGHDYAGAEARYREALDITQTLFGPGHPATAAGLHNLGTTLDALERFPEAERCFRRALEIRTAALGREHAETATTLHNLAGVLDVTGQREEAETLYREAVAVWKAVVGERHPATATSVNNLADLLRETRRYDEAEPLYRENLAIWSELYGLDHPNTAMTAAELGGLYADARRVDQAEPLLRDAVGRLERIMGIDSSLHVDSLCRLAALLRDTGRGAEGAALLKDAYDRAAGTTKVLSPQLQKLRRHLDALRRAGGGR